MATSQAFGDTLDPTNAVELRYDPAFSEQDANIILQSSDGVLYRLPSFTLRTTSGFFRDMMTLPQRDSNTSCRDDDSITLDEPSKVLGILLRMISGFEIPKWEAFGDMEMVLRAAEKYDMQGPRSAIRAAMVPPAFTGQPLEIYAVAARMGWEEEAKIASTGTLTLSIYEDEHTPILDQIPSHYLRRLLSLHRKRRDDFKILVDGFSAAHSLSCNRATGKIQVWEELKARMFKEMDTRPMGDTLLDGDSDSEWPEAAACWAYRCSDSIRCSNVAYSRQCVARQIKAGLNNIPCTI